MRATARWSLIPYLSNFRGHRPSASLVVGNVNVTGEFNANDSQPPDALVTGSFVISLHLRIAQVCISLITLITILTRHKGDNQLQRICRRNVRSHCGCKI